MGTKDMRVSQSLTNYSVGYLNPLTIGMIALPQVRETKSEVFAYTWDKDNFRLDNDERAPGTKANLVTFNLSKGTAFVLTEHALKAKIPKEDMDAAKNADSRWDLKRDHVTLLNDKMQNRHEYQVASLLFNATTFSGYTAALAGNDRWDVYGTSNPVDDVNTARKNVRQAVGVRPNTLILGEEVYDTLCNHPDILDRIKGGATSAKPADVDEASLAKILKVNRVLVGGSVYNSAPEGASDSMADIWGKYALLCYVNPTPNPLSASLGYTYFNPNYERVREWYDDEEESHYVEVKKKYLSKVNSAASGYLWQTVIS